MKKESTGDRDERGRMSVEVTYLKQTSPMGRLANAFLCGSTEKKIRSDKEVEKWGGENHRLVRQKKRGKRLWVVRAVKFPARVTPWRFAYYVHRKSDSCELSCITNGRALRSMHDDGASSELMPPIDSLQSLAFSLGTVGSLYRPSWKKGEKR